MKLAKTKSSVIEPIGGGILCGELTHEIKASSGTCTYSGPKIRKERWIEVLAFFHWVNEKWNSEAQVRMFLDPVDNELLFWAFPQKANTGLQAFEIEGEEAARQRAALPHAEQLIALGTAHSHANAGAFQSATDERDEKNQTGLHITIGDLGKKQFSFHARVYRNGYMFDPDMSEWWEVGGVQIPDEIKALLPNDYADRLARNQMCMLPEGATFPNEWRENVIEVKRPAIPEMDKPQFRDWTYEAYSPPQVGYYQLLRLAQTHGLTLSELTDTVRVITEDPHLSAVSAICAEEKIEPEDILDIIAEHHSNGSKPVEIDEDQFHYESWGQSK